MPQGRCGGDKFRFPGPEGRRWAASVVKRETIRLVRGRPARKKKCLSRAGRTTMQFEELWQLLELKVLAEKVVEEKRELDQPISAGSAVKILQLFRHSVGLL
jgi:hypothetical protein